MSFAGTVRALIESCGSIAKDIAIPSVCLGFRLDYTRGWDLDGRLPRRRKEGRKGGRGSYEIRGALESEIWSLESGEVVIACKGRPVEVLIMIFRGLWHQSVNVGWCLVDVFSVTLMVVMTRCHLNL
ncbi:hypothetical protein COP2_043525 [Malus domestica]